MTLVERFIEISNWPTSRKSTLLMALALPAQLPVSLLAHFGIRETGVADLALLDALLIGGLSIVLLCLLASLVTARAGKEGRWTAYLIVGLYGAFVISAIYALGTWSTAFLGWGPLVVILVALYYGQEMGWFAFVYLMFLLIISAGLQALDLIPYGPLLLNRSIDAQKTIGWVVAIVPAIAAVYFFSFGLCLLIVAARKQQEIRLQKAQRLISRYVPSQIADAIMSGNDDGVNTHARQKLTIFFSDLVGFTDISEELEPEDLSRVLNEYFSEMTTIAHKHGGTVDELSGDAILIFFGAPIATDDRDHALRAVRMATDMQQAMGTLNAKWRAAGITEALQVRMGINTGVVTIGNFGSPDRMKYAALGKHVNIASRLQSYCEPGRILLSHATWLLVNDQVQCTPKGEVQLKGIHKPVMTYELAAP